MKVEWVPLREVMKQSGEPVAVEPTSVYRSAGLLNRGRGLFKKPDLSGANTTYKHLYRLNTNQVVYSKLFGWEGAIAVVGEAFANHFVSSEFPIFDVEEEVIALPYLEHFLLSSRFAHELARATTGLGQRRQRVNVDQFLKLEAPLVARSDQERIAAHLSRFSAAQDDQLPILQSLSQRKWVGEPTPVRSLVESVDRSEAVDPNREYRMQGVKWYGEGLFTRETKLGRELSTRRIRRIEPGDLVYNRLFAWKQSFAIATESGWASNEFPTFRMRTDRVGPRLLLALLLSPEFTESVNHASSGSTPTSRNRLKERDFLALEVNLPEQSDHVRIERQLRLVDQARPLAQRRQMLAAALLPAARNEIFNAMR